MLMVNTVTAARSQQKNVVATARTTGMAKSQ